jgi:platelet-activating factor acetylhydrolase IB subunit beta/gamma
VHIPLLESHLKADPSSGPTIALLGDSMLERFITTGQSPNFPAPFPSPVLLPPEDELLSCYPDEKDPRIKGVFNAGVGGDKIENLIYRLVGDEERGLPALLPLLAPSVKVWIVFVGTNNLSPKKGLSDNYEDVLFEMGKTLLQASPNSELRIIRLCDRKDVPIGLVTSSNQIVKKVSKRLYMEFSFPTSVGYWDSPSSRVGFDIEKHLDDHVHLNLEGYRLWMGLLFFYLKGLSVA